MRKLFSSNKLSSSTLCRHVIKQINSLLANHVIIIMGVKGQYLQHKSIKDRTVFGVSLAHTWFRGKRAVIDIQNLLHRGKAQNPRLLAQLEHEPNLVDLNDVKRLQSEIALFTVNILLKLERECGINFIAVFDGRPLLSKAAENEQRRQDRKKAYCKAVSCVKLLVILLRKSIPLTCPHAPSSKLSRRRRWTCALLMRFHSFKHLGKLMQ